MHQYRGSSALSTFRQQKLITELREFIQALASVSAQYIHFIDAESPLTAEQQHLLLLLLDYGPAASDPGSDGQLILVTPKRGTISPWSSKATDIIHGCGLEDIRRIERGTAFFLSKSDGTSLTDEELARAVTALHDRMTESVFYSMEDAEGLFLQENPATVATVDIIGGGMQALLDADRELGLALSEDELVYVMERVSMPWEGIPPISN